jgi:hypothetical protein
MTLAKNILQIEDQASFGTLAIDLAFADIESGAVSEYGKRLQETGLIEATIKATLNSHSTVLLFSRWLLLSRLTCERQAFRDVARPDTGWLWIAKGVQYAYNSSHRRPSAS